MGDPISIAGAVSLASTGFKAAGQYEEAQGKSAADLYKAQQLDEAAKYGELKADQTNAQMSRNLTLALGNIDAVRAAARTDPTSPTGSAVRAAVEEQGLNEKSIKVSSIQQQARMDESNAAYMRDASDRALLGGDLAIGATLLSGIGGAMKGG